MEIVVQQQELSVSIKVSKQIVPFQQARVRIPNLCDVKNLRCKKLFCWTPSVLKNPTPPKNLRLRNPDFT